MNVNNSLQSWNQQFNYSQRRYLGNHHHPLYFGGPSDDGSIDSCPESPMRTPSEPISTSSISHSASKSDSCSYSSSPKVSYLHKNHNHHHHSIQELIRHFGKKVHNWRSEGGYRRNSSSEDEPKQNNNDEFRGRSKSLDGTAVKRKPLGDCESTYRIYDTILREERRECTLFKLFQLGLNLSIL